MIFHNNAIAAAPRSGPGEGGAVASRERGSLLNWVMFLASLILALGLAEIGLRLALFSDLFAVPQLRQAWRFADSGYEDDHWKLAFMFRAGNRAQRVGHIDPELGWAPEVTPDNPLGLITDRSYRVEDLVNPMPFYGDSFVAGASPIPTRIPQVLDLLEPERSVLNYGVGGYGVDQIFLRFRKTVGDYEGSTALVGILTLDLDRSILGIRTGQKPYFELEGDRLALSNLPILKTTNEYIEQNPVTIDSYLGRFLLFRMRPLVPPELFDSWMGYDELHERKLRVNARLLRAFKEESAEKDVDLRVVLFYSRGEVAESGWREEFLHSELKELGIPYFDSKQQLRRHMTETGLTIRELYYDDNGHPNELGNRVIAEGIHGWLRTQAEGAL
jgi:hypothetical protein